MRSHAMPLRRSLPSPLYSDLVRRRPLRNNRGLPETFNSSLLIRPPPILDRADHVGAEAHLIVLSIINYGHEGMAIALRPAAEDSHACRSTLRRALSAPSMLSALRKREAHGKSHTELGGDRTSVRLSDLFEDSNDCFCRRP